MKANSYKHGHANPRTPTYISWFAMKNRCLNVNYKEYFMYGGAGITVCEKWISFEGFLEDMGVRPDNTSLDRIDPSKGYYKENCRWTTATVQARNTRKHKDGTSKYKGVSYCKLTNKWRAQICVNYKKIQSKRFTTELEAAKVYNELATIHFGTNAVLNKIESE